MGLKTERFWVQKSLEKGFPKNSTLKGHKVLKNTLQNSTMNLYKKFKLISTWKVFLLKKSISWLRNSSKLHFDYVFENISRENPLWWVFKSLKQNLFKEHSYKSSKFWVQKSWKPLNTPLKNSMFRILNTLNQIYRNSSSFWPLKLLKEFPTYGSEIF